MPDTFYWIMLFSDADQVRRVMSDRASIAKTFTLEDAIREYDGGRPFHGKEGAAQ
ncbi:hypothetical protein SAMN05518855_1005147 [Paenibacillus sp. CF384]|nr:hypothetical protein SAMN05518855_1005147 [Paenibacillus sp. CF384]